MHVLKRLERHSTDALEKEMTRFISCQFLMETCPSLMPLKTVCSIFIGDANVAFWFVFTQIAKTSRFCVLESRVRVKRRTRRK